MFLTGPEEKAASCNCGDTLMRWLIMELAVVMPK